MKKLKTLIRIILRPFHKILFYDFNKKNINVTRNGKPLKMGISAVVAMKNEEYTLPLCLKSLIGFADQVIIVDNGSEDDSLQLAKKFKTENEDQIEVDIIEMPGALLGDCREAGLKATRYQWHLRWDADMIAHTDGEFDMKELRVKTLKDETPRTVQLPRINLTGDLFHVIKNKDWDNGEPILIWFNKDISYKEFGKFDTVRVPKYFIQVKENKNYYFHCQGLKSDINLMHRFHYFPWRELVNASDKNQMPEYLKTYDSFVKKRNKHLFETNDPLQVKYRYQRQLVHSFEKINIEKYGYYPVLREEIKRPEQRFEIIYKMKNHLFLIENGRKNEEFTPSQSDLNSVN